MSVKPRVLAVIPARAGSKRLSGKNTKLFMGKPLIAWAIEAAINSDVFVDVLVSTDDTKAAGIAADFGALFLGLRPKALATDTATSVDVVIDAVDMYERHKGPVDGVMLLQPTSVFRRVETIQRAMELFNPERQLVSVCLAKTHPEWCYRLSNDTLEPILNKDWTGNRSQDLEASYQLNGAIYLTPVDMLKNSRSFMSRTVQPLVVDDPAEAVDIDTLWDWTLAEYIYRFQYGSSELNENARPS